MQDDTQVDLNEVPTSTAELNAEEGVVPQGEAAPDVNTTENVGRDDEVGLDKEKVAPEAPEAL